MDSYGTDIKNIIIEDISSDGKVINVSRNSKLKPNVIEGISVNGEPLLPDEEKNVNIDLSDYATIEYVDEHKGEANVIESVKVNGAALTPDTNKAVDIVMRDYVDALSVTDIEKILYLGI